ncbi:hypothetical protein J5N97_009166 [Dioscorea zingiberensis]|uniref:TF-B3 domain-containing protein n=1 Tax=Dioscorea zingiberensis TaxID=325984 RepID=A0A9D5HLQ2_9LILI|nr:hypothetical protein J5N97_009166 [Dioscorea zingiberensis]
MLVDHNFLSDEDFVTPLRTTDVISKEDLSTINSSDDALDGTQRRNVRPLISSSKGTKETSAMLGESFSAPLKSQRRPVTQKELDRALEMSKSFKSTFPFTTLAMRDSYCYHHFQLNLPFYFAKEHMSKVNMKMTLWDPEGRPWTVAYLYYRRRASLRSGWNKFSFANNLESGDVCIFELIKPDEMRVHIFRVLDQVTPLIRFNPRNK